MLDPLRDFPWLRRGYEQGVEKGIEKGRGEGQAKALLTILAARGVTVDAETRRRIESCTDQELLERWLKRAATATGAADVLADS